MQIKLKDSYHHIFLGAIGFYYDIFFFFLPNQNYTSSHMHALKYGIGIFTNNS